MEIKGKVTKELRCSYCHSRKLKPLNDILWACEICGAELDAPAPTERPDIFAGLNRKDTWMM